MKEDPASLKHLYDTTTDPVIETPRITPKEYPKKKKRIESFISGKISFKKTLNDIRAILIYEASRIDHNQLNTSFYFTLQMTLRRLFSKISNHNTEESRIIEKMQLIEIIFSKECDEYCFTILECIDNIDSEAYKMDPLLLLLVSASIYEKNPCFHYKVTRNQLSYTVPQNHGLEKLLPEIKKYYSTRTLGKGDDGETKTLLDWAKKLNAFVAGNERINNKFKAAIALTLALCELDYAEYQDDHTVSKDEMANYFEDIVRYSIDFDEDDWSWFNNLFHSKHVFRLIQYCRKNYPEELSIKKELINNIFKYMRSYLSSSSELIESELTPMQNIALLPSVITYPADEHSSLSLAKLKNLTNMVKKTIFGAASPEILLITAMFFHVDEVKKSTPETQEIINHYQRVIIFIDDITNDLKSPLYMFIYLTALTQSFMILHDNSTIHIENTPQKDIINKLYSMLQDCSRIFEEKAAPITPDEEEEWAYVSGFLLLKLYEFNELLEGNIYIKPDLTTSILNILKNNSSACSSLLFNDDLFLGFLSRFKNGTESPTKVCESNIVDDHMKMKLILLLTDNMTDEDLTTLLSEIWCDRFFGHGESPEKFTLFNRRYNVTRLFTKIQTNPMEKFLEPFKTYCDEQSYGDTFQKFEAAYKEAEMLKLISNDTPASAESAEGSAQPGQATEPPGISP